jgi:hypothetical protein
MRLIHLALLCSLFLGTLACSDTELIIDVGNIPLPATQLRAVVRLSGAQSADVPRFDFSEGRSSFAMGLRLVGQNHGPAEITIGAFRQGCLLSTGKLEIGNLGQVGQMNSLNLDPPLTDASASSCPDAEPVLTGATTSYDSKTGATHLLVQGFGFAPGSHVLLDSNTTAQTGYQSPDPLSFQVDLPTLLPPVGHHLHVAILQPDGSSGQGDFIVSIPVLDTSQPPLYPQSPDDPFLLFSSIVADDLDGDGHVDLIVAANGLTTNSGELLVYFNKGQGGSFAAPISIPLLAIVRDVAAANLRSGGLHDLVAATCQSPLGTSNTYRNCQLAVIQQTSTRSFSNKIINSQDGSENNGQQLALAAFDSNGDGITDIAAVTNALVDPFSEGAISGRVSLLKLYDGRNLSGTGFNFRPFATPQLGAPAVAILGARFARTGSAPPDLAIAENTDNGGQIEFFLNPGTGHFESVTATQVTLSGRPGRPSFGDYDHNGFFDLTVPLLQTPAGGSLSSVSLLLNQSTGWQQSLITSGMAPSALATLDLLSDGSEDLVVASARVGIQPAQLGLLFNLNQGQQPWSTPTAMDLPPTLSATFAVADFTDDQRSDLAVAATGIGGQADVHAGTLMVYPRL